MSRITRFALALLLLAAAFHLPVKALAATVANAGLLWAADHTGAVLAVAAVVLLLRATPAASARLVTALAGKRAARILVGPAATA